LRLAINLGFSFGPAIGGFIIINSTYQGLFWVDGITCIVAAFLFITLLNKKEAQNQKEESKTAKGLSPWKNHQFLLLLLIVFLVAFTFLQYFSTIPLYYKERYLLNEQEIGWLMFLNGFLIFLIEMPLIKAIEKPSISVYSILLVSLVLLASSFLVLYFFSWIGILIIGMVFMTIGEIFNFPFINSLAIKSASGSNLGEYMALFTIAFSLAHIFGHNFGLQLISKFGYETTWLFMTVILILCGFLVLWLKRINLRTK
jgi:predicted MFS family arabinose efflux permease